MQGAPIFNQKALEKLRSPDDLDKMVKVTRPSVWVVLGALVAFLVGILAWEVFGSLSVNVSCMGVVTEGRALALVSMEDARRIKAGNAAMMGGNRLQVANVSTLPLSREEADQEFKSDYLVDTLMKDKWAYEVILEGDTANLAEGIPLTVGITTERVAPITLILGD